MSFSHRFETLQGVQVVHLQGRIDSASASDFETAVQSLFTAAGERAVLDFQSLEYISSAGLRVVLMAAKRARQAQGQLLLSQLPAHVREVFEISGFLKIMGTADTLDAALTQLNR